MNPPTPPIRTYARRAQRMTTRRTQLTKHTKRPAAIYMELRDILFMLQ